MRLTGSAAELAALFSPVAAEPALGLAVSGGADSLALMVLAHRWASVQPTSPRLFVYSVDHRLRPEAAAEVAMVLAEAANFGIPARALGWTGEKPSAGVQAAARHARYQLMGKAMAEDGVRILLTAHHRTDQAETVLMRLAHGSGLTGLKGMTDFAQVEGVTLFRPLLDIDPADLRAVVEAEGMTPVVDPSNLDTQYERVRWRQALPGLAALGLDTADLAGLARRAAEADAAIMFYAAQAVAEGLAVDRLGALHFGWDWYRALPTAVAQRVLAEGLSRAGGSRRPHGLGTVEKMHRTICGDEPGHDTGHGCLIRLRHDRVWLLREPGRDVPSSVTIAPQAVANWDGRFDIINGLGAPVVVAPAAGLTRAGVEELLGCGLDAPAEAIGSAPLVFGTDGSVLALGTVAFNDQLVIRPMWDRIDRPKA